MLDVIVMLIGAVLAIFSVAVLAYPLMKSRSRGQPEIPEIGGEVGFPELDSIYESIRTLRLEFELGKVEENLYRQQMSEYRLLAAAALRRREERQADAAHLLEQEVLIARATLASGDGNSDGNSNGSSDRCPSCGVGLDHKSAECPQCAVKLGLQDRDLP